MVLKRYFLLIWTQKYHFLYILNISLRLKKENILYFILITLSFLVYAPVNYKFLNSDQGIHALMAANFDLKKCTYYWGQNRLGSLLPFLSSFLVKLKLDSLWAVSIVQYAFLTGFFLLIAKEFKTEVLKIAFCIFLFFPLVSFIEVLNIGHPYAPQLFLIATLFILYRNITNDFSVKNIFIIGLFWATSFLSIWVSELSIIPVAMLVVFTFALLQKGVPSIVEKVKNTINSPFLYFLPLGVGLIIVAQRFLKHKFQDLNYEKYGVNTINDVFNAVMLQINRFWQSVTFADNEVLINVFTLLLTLFTFYLVIRSLINFKKIDYKQILFNKGFVFFSISLTTFCAIKFSAWAGIEDYPYRYYAFSYLCFGISLLFFINEINFRNKEKVLPYLFLIISLIGGTSYLKLDKEQGRFKQDKKSLNLFSEKSEFKSL